MTRSGTNAYHGTLFEYFRNNVLDAKDWFVNYNGLPKPAERQNDFGGVLGGPIKKNKTFFFFSYEGLWLHQPATQETSVPDAASRQAVPASLQPYLNAFPKANGPALPNGLAQFSASYSNPSTLDAASIRVDDMIGSKVTLFGRYNYSPSSVDQRGPAFSSGTVLSMTESLSSSVQTATAGATVLITPQISDEFRANYSNDRLANTYAMDGFGGAVPLSGSAVFPPGYSLSNALLQLVILGAGEYSLGAMGTGEQRQVNLVDNLSIAKGSRQMKFGVDYRWLAPFTDPVAYHQFAEFSGLTAAAGGTLSGSTLLAQSGASQADALLSQNFSLYGQDTWKIRPGLTLTYGLRWDINPPLKGKNAANDPFTVTGLNNPATIALAPRGTPLYQTTYGNVAPRVGLAWQLSPDWHTVLRGGFGIFYDLGQGSLGGVSSYFPYLATKTLPSPAPFPLGPVQAAPPPFTVNPPVATIVVAVPSLKLPRSYQWNLALEQPLGNNQSFSVTYIGAIGRDLLRITPLYNPNPNFQFVSVTDNLATSDYHALQLKFNRRLSRGLEALASYMFSHSIDSASFDANMYLSTLTTPNLDRGDSDFDIRHAFTAGVTYNIPSLRAGKIANAVLDGWLVDAFVLARSAPPVDIVGAVTFGAGTALASRPNVNPGVPLELFGSGYPGGKIFNKQAFTPAPAGQQGNFGRNVLRGFDAAQADIGLQRQFRVTEKTSLRFRSEFFNILNHANFANPTNTLSSGLFGRSTQTLANGLGTGGANGGFNPLYQIGGPRSIQLALKLSF